MICITTLPRSLADLGGVFDTPKSKCPPDRGSSVCVTGSPASTDNDIQSSSPPIHYPSLIKSSNPFSDSNTGIKNSNQQSRPRAIPSRTASNLSTPPLTPDDGESDFGSFELSPSLSDISHRREKDALDYLMTLFPRDGLKALPFAKRVSISASNIGMAFDGVVLELPGAPKTLYVDGKSAESVSLRESIVALLDLADESLGCSVLIIVLERASPTLATLLHSLMYVGGTVVTKPVFQVDPAFVLVGLEI